MTLTVSLAGADERALVARLAQLYFHDFSEFDGEDVGPSGLYEIAWLEQYWREPNAAYIFRLDGFVAGFCLVDQDTLLDGSQNSIAEFFILRKYRGTGVGLRAASAVLNKRPGVWEASQIASNLPAQAFWRRVASAFGANEEVFVNDERWHGSVQQFTAIAA
ncbi:GNAT family N-acetyltransferase [Massilia sp. SR12]